MCSSLHANDAAAHLYLSMPAAHGYGVATRRRCHAQSLGISRERLALVRLDDIDVRDILER